MFKRYKNSKYVSHVHVKPLPEVEAIKSSFTWMLRQASHCDTSQ